MTPLHESDALKDAGPYHQNGQFTSHFLNIHFRLVRKTDALKYAGRYHQNGQFKSHFLNIHFRLVRKTDALKDAGRYHQNGQFKCHFLNIHFRLVRKTVRKNDHYLRHVSPSLLYGTTWLSPVEFLWNFALGIYTSICLSNPNFIKMI
jgi:hypothetical protein